MEDWEFFDWSIDFGIIMESVGREEKLYEMVIKRTTNQEYQTAF